MTDAAARSDIIKGPAAAVLYPEGRSGRRHLAEPQTTPERFGLPALALEFIPTVASWVMYGHAGRRRGRRGRPAC